LSYARKNERLVTSCVTLCEGCAGEV